MSSFAIKRQRIATATTMHIPIAAEKKTFNRCTVHIEYIQNISTCDSAMIVKTNWNFIVFMLPYSRLSNIFRSFVLRAKAHADRDSITAHAIISHFIKLVFLLHFLHRLLSLSSSLWFSLFSHNLHLIFVIIRNKIVSMNHTELGSIVQPQLSNVFAWQNFINAIQWCKKIKTNDKHHTHAQF